MCRKPLHLYVVLRIFFHATYSELLIGQGVKVCPMSDLTSMKAVHIRASREDIKTRLGRDRQQKLDSASPTRDVFEKTLAFISALQKNGCPGPLYEPTFLSPEEEESRNSFLEHAAKIRRGYTPGKKTCEGRLYLLHTNDGFPYIRWAGLTAHSPCCVNHLFSSCEHYSRIGTRDHYIQFLNDSYDIDYLEAHFCKDAAGLNRIEATAAWDGYGPLSACTTITNFSAQRVCCREFTSLYLVRC